MSARRAGPVFQTGAPSRASERGFVLVGVVMMVLALTIIGISLYSLSGYESQFFGRSFLDRQALYSSNGGIELAKELLNTPLGSPASKSLSNVKLAIGRENIVSAVAWYDSPFDSTGPMRANTKVHVRVGVNVHGVARTVQGSYTPGNPNSPYWRLFAAANPITQTGGNGSLRAQGGAWHPVASSSDTSWISSLESQSSISMTADALPAPIVASFITSHYPALAGPDTAWVSRDYNPVLPPPHFSNLFIAMDAGPAANSLRYFRAASDSISPVWGFFGTKYSFTSGAHVRVRVRGTAVWILPQGAYFDGDVIFERLPGATTANLVIVAGPGTALPALGVAFGKGVDTPGGNVNVFVVSSSTVRIEDPLTAAGTLANPNLCVYANAIELKGSTGAHRLQLAYPAAMQTVADQLYGMGALPTVTGMVTTTFALEPGSWTTSPGLQ